MPFTRDSCVVVSDEPASTALGDVTVILGMRDGPHYGLDAVGAHVWTLLDDLSARLLVREVSTEDDARLP